MLQIVKPLNSKTLRALAGLSLLGAVTANCGPLPHRTDSSDSAHRSTAQPHDTQALVRTSITDTASARHSSPYKKLMAQYREWRGVPHRDGGVDKRGIDCSAFVERTFEEKFHMSVPGSTKQLKNYGQPVSLKDLKVGDLVLFKTGVVMRHVGIYLGNGDMLHVSSRKGVSISPIKSGYWRQHYWQSRRVLNVY